MKSFEEISIKNKKPLIKENKIISNDVNILLNFCNDVINYLNNNNSIDNLKKKYK